MQAAIRTEPEIRLIRADNPSPLTGSGTNTWLLGRGEVTVIDPGPDLDHHLAGVLAALDPGERISDILLTHAHLDHSALIPRLTAATGAVTHEPPRLYRRAKLSENCPLSPCVREVVRCSTFLYFSGGRDRTMTWDIHRNVKLRC